MKRRKLLIGMGVFWALWLINTGLILPFIKGDFSLLSAILAGLAAIGEILIIVAIELVKT